MSARLAPGSRRVRFEWLRLLTLGATAVVPALAMGEPTDTLALADRAYAREPIVSLDIVKVAGPLPPRTARQEAIERAGVRIGWVDPQSGKERMRAWQLSIRTDGAGSTRRDMWPASAWGPVGRLAEKCIRTATPGGDLRVVFPGPGAGKAAIFTPLSLESAPTRSGELSLVDLVADVDFAAVHVARRLLHGLRETTDLHEVVGTEVGTVRIVSEVLRASVLVDSSTGELRAALARIAPGTMVGILFEGFVAPDSVWPARCPRIVRVAKMPADIPLDAVVATRPEFDTGWAYVCERMTLAASSDPRDFDWKSLAPLLVDARTGKVVDRRTPLPPRPVAEAGTSIPPTKPRAGPPAPRTPPASLNVAAAFAAKPTRSVESTVALAGGAALVIVGLASMYLRRRAA